MKKLLVAGIAAAALYSAPALAADYPMKGSPAQAFNWTGFYIGVNGGYGASAYNDQLRDISNGAANSFSGLSPSGAFGGGQVGYNWQAVGSPFLLGVEADIEGADIRQTSTWTLATSSSKVNWFGTARGRAGYVIDRTMIYATGGWADGHVRNSELGGARYLSDHTHSGYTVGGGLEWFAINAPWSVKAEYQYVNLGKNDPMTAAGVHLSSFAGTSVHDDAFHTFRIGLNYKFW
jgi:outer membrane immunogenic protein